jgi:putative transposase
LTEPLENLWALFMAARQRRPFTVEAMVILPDHLHCIWTKSGKDAKGGMRFAFPPYELRTSGQV